MKFTQLEQEKGKEVVDLFYNTFKASENEEEALAVSSLVEKYLQNYPRQDLKGYVAIDSGQIVGSVFFSQLKYTESDRIVFILSPMAVKTEFHGKGIGQSLINYAHEELKKEGVHLTTTYGDINFYSKTGYELVSTDSIAAPLKLSYPEGWLAYSLDGISSLKLEGPCSCVNALNHQSLW
jgi:predicted N-acetyltransferase YhbS